MVYVHDPAAFKVGDQVRISRKITQAKGWVEGWYAAGMDQLIGRDGIITRSGNSMGFYVAVPNTNGGYWYPSAALARITPDQQRKLIVIQGNNGVPVAAPKATKKKRVRVGTGPWDAAPCSHLRWHLMGIFREKLVLSSVVVKGTQEAVVAEVEVACAKCNTTMTLTAK